METKTQGAIKKRRSKLQEAQDNARSAFSNAPIKTYFQLGYKL